MNLFQKIKSWLFKKNIKNKMLCEKNQQLLLELLARKSPQVPGILLVANKLASSSVCDKTSYPL